MKNLFIGYFSLTLTLTAQVGIGTEAPNENASIDVFAQNLGVLIPQVALTDIYDVNTIANPAVGLYVFNTVDAGSSPNNVEHNSFYFWDGIQWSKLVDEPTFMITLDNLKIPKLAGYWYKQTYEQFFNPTGISIITYDTAQPDLYYFDFGEYIDYNLADPTQTTFIIKKTGVYGMEAFSCILNKVIVSHRSETFFLETVIQKSSNNGASWEDTTMIASVPYNATMTSQLTIPSYLTGTLSLVENDLLRIGVRCKFLTGSPASYSSLLELRVSNSSALGVKYSAGFKATYYP